MQHSWIDSDILILLQQESSFPLTRVEKLDGAPSSGILVYEIVLTIIRVNILHVCFISITAIHVIRYRILFLEKE